MGTGGVQDAVSIAVLAKQMQMEKLQGQMAVQGIAQAAELQRSMTPSTAVPVQPHAVDVIA